MERVFVYFNLHKLVFSVRDRRTGLVVAHSPTVRLEGAEFRVQEGGRQRVLREHRKNVHAGVCGKVAEISDEVFTPEEGTEITYNPYKYDSFVTVEGEHPVEGAEIVLLSGKRVWAWGVTLQER